MSITKEQKLARVLQAIDQAQNPGGCRYAERSGEVGAEVVRPVCVIAQLLAIEGVDMNFFLNDGRGLQGCRIGTFEDMCSARDHPEFQKIKNIVEQYGGWGGPLGDIQALWDRPESHGYVTQRGLGGTVDEGRLRGAMRERAQEAWG